MQSARLQVGASLRDVALRTPRFPVISNVTAAPVESAEQIRQTLQDQVTATVRWSECMERMLEMGCDFFLELGPGGVLAGLLQRTGKGTEVMSVTDAASLQTCSDKLRELSPETLPPKALPRLR
jgi:[acyl-carrier-protein] S-malonyltransferase